MPKMRFVFIFTAMCLLVALAFSQFGPTEIKTLHAGVDTFSLDGPRVYLIVSRLAGVEKNSNDAAIRPGVKLKLTGPHAQDHTYALFVAPESNAAVSPSDGNQDRVEGGIWVLEKKRVKLEISESMPAYSNENTDVTSKLARCEYYIRPLALPGRDPQAAVGLNDAATYFASRNLQPQLTQ